jgi:hypothetical protein
LFDPHFNLAKLLLETERPPEARQELMRDCCIAGIW